MKRKKNEILDLSKDCIVKAFIVSKKTRESNYLLRILDKSDYLNNHSIKLV